MRTPVLVSWSGGKDSALLLQDLLQDLRYEVAGLIPPVTDGYDRISIHGVRREILHAQVAQLGLPLHEATIPPAASNAAYEAAFAVVLARLRASTPSPSSLSRLALSAANMFCGRRASSTVTSGWAPDP